MKKKRVTFNATTNISIIQFLNELTFKGPLILQDIYPEYFMITTRENYTLPPSTITHFFILPPKLPKCTIYPPIASNCTIVTSRVQNRIRIDGIVQHVTRTWCPDPSNQPATNYFFENPKIPLPLTLKHQTLNRPNPHKS